jgi:hypothetical protein
MRIDDGLKAHVLVGVDQFGPYTLGSWAILSDGLEWLARRIEQGNNCWTRYWWEIR